MSITRYCDRSLRLTVVIALIWIVLLPGCEAGVTGKQQLVTTGAVMDDQDNIEQLELIRAEAIRYLKEHKPTNWKLHVNELIRGGAMHIDDTYRIGRWIFDFKSLTLLREADIQPEVRRYGLVFEKEGKVYRVAEDFWESESYDFGE